MSTATVAPAELALNSTPVVFQGPLDKANKKDLQAICVALNILIRDEKDQKLYKKDVLIRLIEERFDTETSLAQDARFAQLYEHRKGKKPSKGGEIKTSAEKTAEDLAEQAKTIPALTGANLKLHQKKLTTDPKGSLVPLQLGLKALAEGGVLGRKAPTPSESSLTNASKTSKAPSVEEEDNKEEEEEVAGGKEVLPSPPSTVTGNVLVKFEHPHIENFPSAEVYVGNVAIDQSVSTGGSLIHETKLTTLVPVILNNFSPMKNDRAGRLARHGLGNGGKGHLAIGSVAQHVDGPLPECLAWDRVNHLPLTKSAARDDEYECTLFFQPSATTVLPSAAINLTGAGTDRPLEIAQERAAVAALVPKKGSGPEFYQFMRELVGVTEEFNQPKNVDAGTGLDNYRGFDTYYQKFSKYLRPKGAGYHIPANLQLPATVTVERPERFLGLDCTKIDVIFSCGLKKSSTSDNHILFGKALKLNTDAGEYVRKGRCNEDNAHIRDLEAQFDDMDYGTFKKLLEEELEELEDTKPGPSKRKRSKRARTPNEDSDSDGESERQRKRDKKAKRLQKELSKLQAKGKAGKTKGKGKDKEIDSDSLDK
ncbi:hypothetical protein C8R46DRAFT_284066 [Mycena filopes]|nr:hypothetical protein C8R46DRAFT_284066 [Mycena filopes]